jgi:hypothetical protein
MAIVDVYVFMRKVGNGISFVLHSGQVGPAATVFHALLGALIYCSAIGEWSDGHAHMRVNGSVLRSILGDIHVFYKADWQEAQVINTAAFRESIMDDAEYVVKAIQY